MGRVNDASIGNNNIDEINRDVSNNMDNGNISYNNTDKKNQKASTGNN